jgi:hypothetical protein
VRLPSRFRKGLPVIRPIILHREDILTVQHNKCWLCGKFMMRNDGDPDNWTARQRWWVITKDHLLPYAKGGRGVNNVVYAHAGCNHSRGAITTPEMLRKGRMILIGAAAHNLARRYGP